MLPLFILQTSIKGSLSPTNFYSTVRSPIPTVVRFMTFHRPRSLQLDQDWRQFQETYAKIEGVRTAFVNCGKFRRLCVREGVWDPPAVTFYVNGTATHYEGGMSHDSLSEFVHRMSGIQGIPISADLLSPNNRTFHELLDKKLCVFTMFHAPWCKKCRRFMGALADIARSFKEEPSISVCEVDVDKFKSFFFDFELREFPAFRLFVNGSAKIYSGAAEKASIVDFINDYCGTQRSVGGSLSSDAGVIDEVSPIVEDFIRKRNPKYISDMEAVDGTQYYVSVMKRIVNESTGFLIPERERILTLVSSRAADPKILDELKVKANILSVFISYLSEP